MPAYNLYYAKFSHLWGILHLCKNALETPVLAIKDNSKLISPASSATSTYAPSCSPPMLQ